MDYKEQLCEIIRNMNDEQAVYWYVFLSSILTADRQVD